MGCAGVRDGVLGNEIHCVGLQIEVRWVKGGEKGNTGREEKRLVIGPVDRSAA